MENRIKIIIALLLTCYALQAQPPIYGDRMFISSDGEDTLRVVHVNDSVIRLTPDYSMQLQYAEMDSILSGGTWYQVADIGSGGASLTSGSGINIIGDSINWNGSLSENVELTRTVSLTDDIYQFIGDSGEGTAEMVFRVGSTSSDNSRIIINDNQVSLLSDAGVSNNYFRSFSTGLRMGIFAGNATFQDLRSTKKGFEYENDYSADYTNRSLVDKAYVDAQVSGTGSQDSVYVEWQQEWVRNDTIDRPDTLNSVVLNDSAKFEGGIHGTTYTESFASSKTISFANQHDVEYTVTGGTTITIEDVRDGSNPKLAIQQDGTGGHSVTINGATAAANTNTIPTAANSVCILQFEEALGTIYYFVTILVE